MAFQSCPRTASIVIKGSSNGKEIANVLHAKFPVDYGAPDIANLATQVANYVQTAYPPLMSANLLLTEVTVTGLQNENDFQSTVTTGSVPGTAGGLPLPGNNSLVCTFRSALTGRSARGRVYTFPTGAANLASGGLDQYTTLYVADVTGLWTGVQTVINVAGWNHVILSRFSNKNERPSGVTFSVTSVSCRNDTADSQRRRLPRGH